MTTTKLNQTTVCISTSNTSASYKELVEELRGQWNRLWQERVDDKVRAEGIAVTDYSKLFVERGTVIHASRDYKALDFKEILEKNRVENSERFIQPSPEVGGWGSFIRKEIVQPKERRNKRAAAYCAEKKSLQPRKTARGWLHY